MGMMTGFRAEGGGLLGGVGSIEAIVIVVLLLLAGVLGGVGSIGIEVLQGTATPLDVQRVSRHLYILNHSKCCQSIIRQARAPIDMYGLLCCLCSIRITNR